MCWAATASGRSSSAVRGPKRLLTPRKARRGAGRSSRPFGLTGKAGLDRERVGHPVHRAATTLAEAVQDATGEHVALVYVDQGYTGDVPADAAADYGIELHVVKLPEAKHGFV